MTVATFTSSNPAWVFCTEVSWVVNEARPQPPEPTRSRAPRSACSAVLTLASSAVRAAFNCVAVGVPDPNWPTTVVSVLKTLAAPVPKTEGPGRRGPPSDPRRGLTR